MDKGSLKEKVHSVIFGTETRMGRLFDVTLLCIIIFSVLVVVIESVPGVSDRNPVFFTYLEWGLTLIFTLEYLLRVWSSYSPRKYIFSFWGIIDFMSVIPAYLGLFLVGAQYFIIVRILRLLRVFRILKLTRYSTEASTLITALKRSRHKISVFLLFVVLIVFVMGTLMYVVEGENNGFKSIPESIYWCIVTITTVGYGDIVPKTFLGKFISSLSMIIGYAIIAIPTGIVSVALNEGSKEKEGKAPSCSTCNGQIDTKDTFCRHCGSSL